jgi:hypothetical protein
METFSARRQADLFLAELLGEDASASGVTAASEASLPRGWRVALRPGGPLHAVRPGDLVVRRAGGGDGWRVIRAEDVDPSALRADRSRRLRDGLVVLRPIPGEAASSDAGEDAPVTCAASEAVSDTLALLRTPRVPLPVTPKERARASGIPGAIDDYQSVAAVVPTPTERRLLVFFHGNRDYVTIAKSGDVPKAVDPTGHSRVPRWADERGRRHALLKPAVALRYRFHDLPAAQKGLALPDAASGRTVKNPTVLTPADAEISSSSHSWNAPPQGQYGKPDDGTPQGPGTMALVELLWACYAQLRCLLKPSGGTYLPAAATNLASWLPNMQRIYVAGHSGGGKPLGEAAGGGMLLVGPHSRAGTDSRAVDLWLLDATYGWGTHNYVNFCKSWRAAGLLANKADGARLVCVYRAKDADSDTETEANALRTELATLLGVPAPSLLVEHDSTDMAAPSMRTRVLPALTTAPVVFVRTKVAHEEIPKAFIPVLLRTAAS